jgi:hypothetical protein
VKFELTPAFEGDWAPLSRDERATLERVVREAKAVEGAPGVWELTSSFAGLDGRATFEWIEIDDAPGGRWRRIGGHAIYGAP